MQKEPGRPLRQIAPLFDHLPFVHEEHLSKHLFDINVARALHINNQSRDRGTLLLRSRRTFCCVFSLDCGSLTRLLCAIIALESLDLHFKTHCSVSASYLLQPERRALKSSIPEQPEKRFSNSLCSESEIKLMTRKLWAKE